MFSDELFGGASADDLAKPFGKPEDPAKQLRAYLATLPLNERRAYIANMRGQQAAPERKASTPFRRNDNMDEAAFQDFGNLLAANHFAAQEQGVKQANDIIGEEMDRRVAISREQRRMALELEKERMRQETERMKVEALLKRLEMENGGGITIYH